MKRNCVSTALCAFVFVFSVIISSCGDSGTEPQTTKINITGKIYALLNIPVSNVIVKVNDKATTTNAYGEFAINDVTTPYDLKIIDTVRKAGYIFKGLTRTDLDIPLFYVPQNQSSTSINISFPENISNYNSGKVIFTDGNHRSYYGDLSNFTIYLGNNTSLTGKVILMLFSRDYNGSIVSYDNYGEKDSITVTAGGTTNLVFTSAELQLNPGEVTVSGSFSGLQGFNSYKFFTLSFGKRKTSGYSTSLLFSEIQGDFFNLVLPTNLPTDYTPLIYLNKYGNNLNGNIAQQYKLPKGGTGINLSTIDVPALINPLENSINIDTTTLFEWTTGMSNGIYRIQISNPADTIEYSIYTNLTSTTLSGLNSLGLGNIANRSFSWNCEKYGLANSLDEYLDPARNNLEYFKAGTSSRNFSTKP